MSLCLHRLANMGAGVSNPRRSLVQILFLSGLAFVIGLERTFRFFFQSHKVRGTASFFGGILVVLLGWPLVGMVIELYGFVVLFRWALLLYAALQLIFVPLCVNQSFRCLMLEHDAYYAACSPFCSVLIC